VVRVLPSDDHSAVIASSTCDEAIQSSLVLSDFELISRRLKVTRQDDEARHGKSDRCKTKAAEITRGSGNVFADLGLPDAEELQTKLRLAYALNAVIDRARLSQTAAAMRLGLNQPKVSALRNTKLEGLSVERLMTLLTTLDQDVEIAIRKKPRSRAAGISVVVA
jgi:predicted XRE-type DNA-binding protein